MSTNLFDLVGQHDSLPSCHYIKSANYHVLTWGPEHPVIYIPEFTATREGIKYLHWLHAFKTLRFHDEDETQALDNWFALCKATPVTKKEGGFTNDTQYVSYVINLSLQN